LTIKNYIELKRGEPQVKKSLKIFALILLSIYLIWKGLIPGWTQIKTDFPNYYVAAKVIANGTELKKLYDDAWFQSKILSSGINADGKFSPFPPITGVVMLPISSLEPMQAKRVWLAMSLLFFIGSILLVRDLSGLSLLSSVLVMLIMGRALSNDIYFGQLYLFISFFLLFSIWLIEKKDMEVVAGIILAIITVIKYFPVLIVGWALINRKARLVLSAIFSVIFLLVFQVWYFGFDLMDFYLNDILLMHLTGAIPNQGQGFPIAFQSWPSLLNNTFVYHSTLNPNPLINWPLGKTVFIVIIYLGIIVMTGWQIIRLKKSRLEEIEVKYLILTILIVAGLALSPAGATYHFLFLIIPAFVYVFKSSSTWSILAIVVIIIINFSPYLFRSNENVFLLILSYPRLLGVNALLFLTYMIIGDKLKSSRAVPH
jgi:hypothetical protein